jgi:hypothetical protein
MLLIVIKDGELVDTHELSASKRVYKVGRQAGVADMFLDKGRGPACVSRKHRGYEVPHNPIMKPLRSGAS